MLNFNIAKYNFSKKEVMSVRDYLSQIKSMAPKELGALCPEIREEIIDAVSKNGGHLSSNLGMVEATVALHKVFNSPEDKIIFDVGHQAYAHKIITGRSLDTLRTYGGISGFPSKKESEHDVLYEGHSGTSISAALGIAEANRLNGSDSYAVAVIGDGSLTNGIAHEALNNCGGKNLKLIIIVNDNEMSIDRNVGALTKYLSNIRISRSYFRFKRNTKAWLRVLGFIGKPFIKLFAFGKNTFRRLFLSSTMFEDMGLDYIGPVDGHNIKKLVSVLEEAKVRKSPVVVHIKTQKGRGYASAELEPNKYHGVPPFDKEKGVELLSVETFSQRAGKALCDIARDDESVLAITAAMADGTGLTPFKSEFKDRFFDVGIAEEHAVTFSSGLSTMGKKPVLALYSTFAQRIYDEALHDIAIQSLPLTLLLDRCGLVSGDGITHQGIFDYQLFSSVPGAKIYSPENFLELDLLIKDSVSKNEGLSVIRYPKGTEEKSTLDMMYDSENMIYYTKNLKTAKTVIVTYGRMTQLASDVAKENDDVAVIKLLKIFPLNGEKLKELTKNASLVYFLEEIYKFGSVGEKLSACLTDKNVYIHAINDFVSHGSLMDLRRELDFTKEAILERIKERL